MAGPLVGIPILYTLIAGIFTNVFNFLSRYLTQKVAFFVTGVALIAALTAGFIGATSSLVGGLSSSAPVFGDVYNLFLPSNFNDCISIVFAAKLAAWFYSWHVKIIQWKFDL